MAAKLGIMLSSAAAARDKQKHVECNSMCFAVALHNV
jgi:hypothetical protein